MNIHKELFLRYRKTYNLAFKVIDQFFEHKQGLHILDLGSGESPILIHMLENGFKLTVDCIDKDESLINFYETITSSNENVIINFNPKEIDEYLSRCSDEMNGEYDIIIFNSVLHEIDILDIHVFIKKLLLFALLKLKNDGYLFWGDVYYGKEVQEHEFLKYKSQAGNIREHLRDLKFFVHRCIIESEINIAFWQVCISEEILIENSIDKYYYCYLLKKI